MMRGARRHFVTPFVVVFVGAFMTVAGDVTDLRPYFGDIRALATDSERERFASGFSLFTKPRTVAAGLGPAFSARSCVQ